MNLMNLSPSFCVYINHQLFSGFGTSSPQKKIVTQGVVEPKIGPICMVYLPAFTQKINQMYGQRVRKKTFAQGDLLK